MANPIGNVGGNQNIQSSGQDPSHMQEYNKYLNQLADLLNKMPKDPSKLQNWANQIKKLHNTLQNLGPDLKLKGNAKQFYNMILDKTQKMGSETGEDTISNSAGLYGYTQVALSNPKGDDTYLLPKLEYQADLNSIKFLLKNRPEKGSGTWANALGNYYSGLKSIQHQLHLPKDIQGELKGELSLLQKISTQVESYTPGNLNELNANNNDLLANLPT